MFLYTYCVYTAYLGRMYILAKVRIPVKKKKKKQRITTHLLSPPIQPPKTKQNTQIPYVEKTYTYNLSAYAASIAHTYVTSCIAKKVKLGFHFFCGGFCAWFGMTNVHIH